MFILAVQVPLQPGSISGVIFKHVYSAPCFHH
nr:MAG TPA: hypothetical protein [Caudoviricetes sp.]